jgi:hypothetical protein
LALVPVARANGFLGVLIAPLGRRSPHIPADRDAPRDALLLSPALWRVSPCRFPTAVGRSLLDEINSLWRTDASLSLADSMANSKHLASAQAESN